MLLINPQLLLYDVGFQLSFMATFGLIMVAPFIEKFLTFMPQLLGMREFLAATLVTQIFVLPLLLYHIGEVSLIAVVANVVVLPMVPVAMLLTFAVGLLGYVSTTLSLLLAYVAHVSLSYIIVMASWLSSVPLATVTVPTFSFAGLIISYVGLALLVWKFVALKQPAQDISTVDPVPHLELDDWVIEEEPEVRSTSGSSSGWNSSTNRFR